MSRGPRLADSDVMPRRIPEWIYFVTFHRVQGFQIQGRVFLLVLVGVYRAPLHLWGVYIFGVHFG